MRTPIIQTVNSRRAYNRGFAHGLIAAVCFIAFIFLWVSVGGAP